MTKKKTFFTIHYSTLALLAVTLMMASCFGGKLTQASQGGEVTGYSTGRGFNEPTPYGMTLINRGFLHMGAEKSDSLWGITVPTKDISVDGFWMDEREVSRRPSDSTPELEEAASTQA